MSKADTRESALWTSEAMIARRIVGWFQVLRKLHSAANAGVDPAALIEQVKLADSDMLDHDAHWLMVFLRERMQSEMSHIDRDRIFDMGRPDEKITADKIRAAVSECRKPTVAAVAQKLDVRADTLSRKLRENPDLDWR